MIKPELQGKIAYFKPDKTHYVEENAKKDAISMRSFFANFKAMDVRAVLFSLKNVPDIENSSLIFFLKLLSEIEKSLDIVVGISDYHPKLFSRVLPYAKKLSVSMFVTSEVANYMLGEKNLAPDTKVCVLPESELEYELIRIEVESKGDRFVGYENEDQFFSDLKSAKNSFFIHKCYFDFLHNKTVARMEGGMVFFELQERLGKKIATIFPYALFVKRLKEGFKVFVMDAAEVKSIDPKAIEYFISLSMNSQKFSAQILFIHLNKGMLQRAIVESMKKAHIMFFDTLKELQSSQEVKVLLESRRKSGNNGELNRALISKLPLFIDATVMTFSSLLGNEPIKISHKISEYEDSFITRCKYLGSSMEFRGEIEGSLMLMFDNALTNKISDALLGVEPENLDESLDVLKEFLNIISGQAKTLLSQGDIAVSISLPKTFASENDLKSYVKNKKGVLVNLKYDDSCLQLFLIP